MADRKISDLTALTTPASGDYLPIVDISEASAANKNKRITIEELLRGAPDGTAGAPGIGFESDSNTGIYSPGADALGLVTAGTERLRITSAGLVGIGASSPSVRLQVQDSIAGGSDGTVATLHNFSDTGGDTRYVGLNFRIGSDNGTSAIRAYRTNSASNYETNLSFWTNPAGGTQTPLQAMKIDSYQRVGIGDTGPDSTLTIKAAASTTPLRVSGPSSEFLRCDQSGRLLVGTSSDSGGALLQVNGNRIRVATAKTPSSASDTGTAGEICWDADYIYVCTATNTWKRTAISTWP